MCSRWISQAEIGEGARTDGHLVYAVAVEQPPDLGAFAEGPSNSISTDLQLAPGPESIVSNPVGGCECSGNDSRFVRGSIGRPSSVVARECDG